MSALAPAAVSRPAAFRRLLGTEAVLFLRTPAAVLWAAFIPVIAFVVLGCFPGLRKTDPDLGGISLLVAEPARAGGAAARGRRGRPGRRRGHRLPARGALTGGWHPCCHRQGATRKTPNE